MEEGAVVTLDVDHLRRINKYLDKLSNKKMNIINYPIDDKFDLNSLLSTTCNNLNEYLHVVSKNMFIDRLISKCPGYNFSLLQNNLSDLKIKVYSPLLGVLLLHFNLGDYNIEKNIINIYNDKTFMAIIFHELFHMASAYYDRNNGAFASGFYYNKRMGLGINEGFTQLLTEKYFPDYILPNEHSYENEVKIAKILTELSDINLEPFYFSANLNKLIESLSYYNDINTIKKLLIACDKYTMSIKGFSAETLYYLDIINKILIEMYIKKNPNNDLVEIMDTIPLNYNNAPVNINNYQLYDANRYIDLIEDTYCKVLRKK